jgi:hypothetical protein
VLGAITSVQQRLKLYNRVPDNGLVLYCGSIITEEGKEKKVNIDFEPFRAINTSLYLCDNKFHTEALSSLLADDSTFGFIVSFEFIVSIDTSLHMHGRTHAYAHAHAHTHTHTYTHTHAHTHTYIHAYTHTLPGDGRQWVPVWDPVGQHT